MPKAYKWRVPKSPASDPQQNLVYRMESEAIGAKYFRLPRKDIRALLLKLARNYGTPPVRVQFSPLKRCAAEWVPPDIIRFNSVKGTARDLITVTHEFAHHLHSVLAPDAVHYSHGKEFVACHGNILDTIRYLPIYAFNLICDRYGVEYTHVKGPPQSLKALRTAIR